MRRKHCPVPNMETPQCRAKIWFIVGIVFNRNRNDLIFVEGKEVNRAWTDCLIGN